MGVNADVLSSTFIEVKFILIYCLCIKTTELVKSQRLLGFHCLLHDADALRNISREDPGKKLHSVDIGLQRSTLEPAH